MPPSCFSDKASFIPGLSGAHLLALLSITQPVVRRHTGGFWPSRCVFDHSCDLQQTCRLLALGRGKHAAKPASTAEACKGRFSSPCRLYQDAPAVHYQVTLSGLCEMAHSVRDPRAQLRNAPLGNEMPPVGDLLCVATLHTACSWLTLRAACHSTSFTGEK